MLLLAAGACGEDATQAGGEPAAVVGAGAACGGATGCDWGLVCLEGRCAPRGWPPSPSTPDKPSPPDVVLPEDVDAVDADVPHDAQGDAGPDAEDVDADDGGPEVETPDAEVDGDADAAEDEDTVDAPVTDAGDELPDDAAPEIEDAADAAEVGPDALDASDVSDADADAGGTPLVLFIQEDTVVDGEGTKSIVVKPGEGWATDLFMQYGGKLIGLQVLARKASTEPSCGLFAPAAWIGDAGGWPAEPTWQASVLQPVQGIPSPQLLLFDDGPMLPAGQKVRLGLILVDLCDGDPPPPVLVSDASGDADDSWYFQPGPVSTPWIPVGFFGVEGRWVVRALVEAVLP